MSMEKFKKYLEQTATFFQMEPKKDLALVLVGIVMGTWFGWDILEILIFALLVLAVLRAFPSRLMILPAILFLVLTMLLLSLDRSTQAEEFSVFAYYFMGISIILALMETWKTNKE